MIKNLYVNKMLFYGKSAIGLGETLNIPATTKDLIEGNKEETDKYMQENYKSYDEYCRTYYKGRSSNAAMHDFLKREHKEKRFLAEVTTADDLIDRFYGTFPNIYSYLTNCAEQAVRDGLVKTSDPVERIRFFAKPNDNSDVNSIKRAAQNFPIQGELMPCINRVNSVDTLSQSARAILSQAII